MGENGHSTGVRFCRYLVVLYYVEPETPPCSSLVVFLQELGVGGSSQSVSFPCFLGPKTP